MARYKMYCMNCFEPLKENEISSDYCDKCLKILNKEDLEEQKGSEADD